MKCPARNDFWIYIQVNLETLRTNEVVIFCVLLCINQVFKTYIDFYVNFSKHFCFVWLCIFLPSTQSAAEQEMTKHWLPWYWCRKKWECFKFLFENNSSLTTIINFCNQSWDLRILKIYSCHPFACLLNWHADAAFVIAFGYFLTLYSFG